MELQLCHKQLRRLCHVCFENGGGKIESDGSWFENPRKYPSDALDGFKKQNERKRLERLAPKGKVTPPQKKNNEDSFWRGGDLNEMMWSELHRRINDAQGRERLTRHEK